MVCNNCGAGTEGKFCAQCGQKHGFAKLTMHELGHEVWHAFTHTDKGILRLLKDLVLHPHSVYINYFNGQRKKYFSPVLFFLVTAGLIAYLYPFVFDYEDKVVHMYNTYGREIYHLTKYRALIMLPLQALVTWLFFKKRFNLAEVTVFWLFALGLTHTFRIVAMPLFWPFIYHKNLLDDIIINITYLIILWQAIALFGNRSIVNILLLLLIVNFFFILDVVLQFYIIFDLHFLRDNNIGVHTWWQLIKLRYSLS